MTENDYRSRIFEADISTNAKLVCLAILQYRNRKTGLCYPSQQTIAMDCSMSRNTVASATKELETNGFFRTKMINPDRFKYRVKSYTFPLQCSPDEQSNEQSNEQSFQRSNQRSPDEHKPIEPIKPIDTPLSPPKGRTKRGVSFQNYLYSIGYTEEDFDKQLPDEMYDFATKEHHIPHDRVITIYKNFRDYWFAKPTNNTKKDWPATWRVWVRKEMQQQERYNGRI